MTKTTITKKTTKTENFNAIKAILVDIEGTENLIKFIDHEIELIAKKSSNKDSKMAQINAQLDERIVALIEANPDGLTATQVLKMVNVDGIEDLKELSLPKINNRLTAIGKEQKRLDRVQDKKVVTFVIGTGKGYKEKKQEQATVVEDEGV